VANRQHTRDEPGIKMLIPDFYRGDSHVIMLEIAVPPGMGRRNIASISLKYKDLVSQTNRETHANVAIDYTPDRAAMIASIDRSVKKNLLGFQTGEALTHAADLVGQGRIAEAVKQVDERMVVMGVAAREWNDRDLDHDGQLLSQYKSVLTDLNAHPQQARAEYGQYLSRSLTYNGYQMTR
jgi:Ca-activated chloride channel family protein